MTPTKAKGSAVKTRMITTPHSASIVGNTRVT